MCLSGPPSAKGRSEILLNDMKVAKNKTIIMKKYLV